MVALPKTKKPSCANRSAIARPIPRLAPVTNAMGYNMGSVQIQGNTAQFVNAAGYTTQTATIYPNQVIIQTPNGITTSVIGNTSYSIPPSPPTVPTVRVLQ